MEWRAGCRCAIRLGALVVGLTVAHRVRSALRGLPDLDPRGSVCLCLRHPIHFRAGTNASTFGLAQAVLLYRPTLLNPSPSHLLTGC